MQTNLGTKSVCSLVTKRSSNGFGYTNLDHSRSHKIEKKKKNGFGPFSYKFFVPIRVGLTVVVVVVAVVPGVFGNSTIHCLVATFQVCYTYLVHVNVSIFLHWIIALEHNDEII